ncbi:restriction endonuclease [Streptomyces sp. NPDC020141]|uniref:restriction endonuclease n=1 Tax=Streptomyces sp. NPDC020141 TaxID=3365065 RepID=UPI0037AC8B04
MTAQGRRAAHRPRRRASFSLRQTAFAFGLAAILLCGAGLMLRALFRAAGEYRPLAYALTALAATAVLLVAVRARRRRPPAPRPLVPGPREPAGPETLRYEVIEPGIVEAGSPGRGAAAPAGFEPAGFAPAGSGTVEPAPLDPGYAEHEPVDPGPAAYEPVEPEPVDFAAMDPVVFEEAVAALCERDGCRDVEVNGGAGDLGADVTAIAPSGLRVVIQCKRYVRRESRFV